MVEDFGEREGASRDQILYHFFCFPRGLIEARKNRTGFRRRKKSRCFCNPLLAPHRSFVIFFSMYWLISNYPHVAHEREIVVSQGLPHSSYSSHVLSNDIGN